MFLHLVGKRKPKRFLSQIHFLKTNLFQFLPGHNNVRYHLSVGYLQSVISTVFCIYFQIHLSCYRSIYFRVYQLRQIQNFLLSIASIIRAFLPLEMSLCLLLAGLMNLCNLLVQMFCGGKSWLLMRFKGTQTL